MGLKLNTKKAKKITKGIVNNLNPLEWVDSAVDAAVNFAIDGLFDSLEDSSNAENGQPIIKAETTNYVNNYHTTNSSVTLSQNNVTTPVYRRPFNYRIKRYKYDPQPLFIPAPILPVEIDTQTSFASPAGTSINIKNATDEERSIFGKTKFHPASSQKKGLKRTTADGKILNQYQKAQQEAINSLETAKNNEPVPIEHQGYLYATSNLAGLTGSGHILFGINSISALAQSYRVLSSNAFIEPTNEIPVEYEKLTVNDKVEDLIFNGKAENIKNNLWDKFGYTQQEWEDKTIEDIIKDFGKKIYEDKQLKNIDDKVLFNLKDKFETIEEFAIGLISSIFYRSGFHRLPAVLPESLLLDREKYKDPKDQPSIFIEDSFEYQEYLLRNIDGLMGQFPIQFKVNIEDDKGQPQTKEVKFPNISEALTEIIGTLIGVAKDSDTAVAFAVKNLIETVKCSNLALTAVDTARANADYLGYKAEEIERTVLVPFNPEGKNLNEFLKDTELKITTFDNVEDDTLIDQLKLISIAAQITKSALAQRKNFITGDAIINQRQEEKEKYNDDWSKLLEKYDGSTSTTQTKSATKPFPNAKIKDKSINQP